MSKPGFFGRKFRLKNIKTRGGKFKNPRVFTEQSVAMITMILKSSIATEVSENKDKGFQKYNQLIFKVYLDYVFCF